MKVVVEQLPWMRDREKAGKLTIMDDGGYIILVLDVDEIEIK